MAFSQSNAPCQTCKIRRIRCDGKQPICRNCTKSGRVCVETTAVRNVCFTIHDERQFACGRSKRPRGPRSSLTLMRPYIDLQTRALTNFLQLHIQKLSGVPDFPGGVSECVLAWITSKQKCQMVDLAISSLATAIFARTHNHPTAATAASAQYQCLLQIMQKQIVQSDLASKNSTSVDAMLIAIFLMGRYEAVIHCLSPSCPRHSTANLQSWSHYDGMMAILKVWVVQNHAKPTTIIKHARRQIIKSSIMRKTSLPDWILDGSMFGERGLELEYDHIFIRMTCISFLLQDPSKTNKLQDHAKFELDNELQELHRLLQGLIARFSEIYECDCLVWNMLGAWSESKRYTYSASVHTHKTPESAAIWLEFLSTCMLMYNMRLNILEKCHATPGAPAIRDDQQQLCVAMLKISADDLAASMPYCLGRLETNARDASPGQPQNCISSTEILKPYLANWVIWPLTIASSLSYMDMNQKSWFRHELANLGKVIGSGVLECAKTNHMVKL